MTVKQNLYTLEELLDHNSHETRNNLFYPSVETSGFNVKHFSVSAVTSCFFCSFKFMFTVDTCDIMT